MGLKGKSNALSSQFYHQEKDLSFNPAGKKRPHSFQIRKISNEKRMEIEFAISSLEILHFFANLLHLQNLEELQQKLSSKLLKKVILVIRRLAAFIKDCKKS